MLIIIAMNPRTVKIKILQLVKVYGSRIKVAQKLHISERYVYYLQKGKTPGWRLYRDICELYSDSL